MPRWQQHKIIFRTGISSHSAVFSTAGQHWAEYCAASITVSWAEKIVARQPLAVLSIHAQAAPLQGIASRS